MPKAGWQDEVLEFWFEELTAEDWFTQKDAVDETIRDRFGDLHEELRHASPEHLDAEPQTALAAIIVFDQFPRNMFRKTGKAFATDHLALAIAQKAVEAGFDRNMETTHKQFLYMPFMHSEQLTDQNKCVELFGTLGSEESLKFAVQHRDIIERFGRFPHRNKALGRQSTAEETAFMEEHSGFGQ